MTKPANLIFFLSDNHTGDLLGCYGHPVVQTPNLDRIAARGARFANSYSASPLCCPARASLATGRYPHQTGYWDNSIAYDGRVASWGHRLKERSHPTVSIGKLHYRSTEDDNGFVREIVPMHIVDGIGGLTGLLRWSGEQPAMPGQWELYWERSGVGESEYQDYDREITREAIAWLEQEAAGQAAPWVLLVSYVSAHPPFLVPKRLYDLYPHDRVPLPVLFRPDEMPRHPALEHIRKLKLFQTMDDEAVLRRIAAGYFALVTHLDEQIGQVMAAAERLDLLGDNRVIYTSDHGESYGHHGLFGKNHLMEPAVRVPLIVAGPGIPAERAVNQIASAVDLFPTILEGAGVPQEAEDRDLPGISLWPAMTGRETPRVGFAEFHASASRAGGFLWRDGADKLIYHVGMASQLYDLEADPIEARDRVADGTAGGRDRDLESALRAFVDPEAVDARAKADQRAQAERHGGTEAIARQGTIVYTPPPGQSARYG